LSAGEGEEIGKRDRKEIMASLTQEAIKFAKGIERRH
jgi:hypothetical protein